MGYIRPCMHKAVLAISLLAAGTARADGTDFAPQVRAMFRVAACGSSDTIPERFAARTIDAHCKEMAAVYASYRKAWADEVKTFVSQLRPKDLPSIVVYPFGGGDLSS